MFFLNADFRYPFFERHSYGNWSFAVAMQCSKVFLASISVLLLFASSTTTGQAAPRRYTALIELGQAIFFDTGFSDDATISCASCHQPDQAFCDRKPRAQGVHGRLGTRNTPSLRNIRLSQTKFWDGRRPTLESQVLDPFVNANEHGLRDQAELLWRLRQKPFYKTLIAKAFGINATQVRPEQIASALSAFLLTLTDVPGPLDHYLFKHKTTALDRNARHGLELFRGRAQCATCHLISDTAAPLTDGDFHSLALGFDRLVPKLPALVATVFRSSAEERDRLVTSDRDIASLGRFVVTLKPADIGKFKTPSLRNVADTPPYMHDGSVATLEEALDREIYYRGKAQGRPLLLSLAERADLLAFLRALKEPQNSTVSDENNQGGKRR